MRLPALILTALILTALMLLSPASTPASLARSGAQGGPAAARANVDRVIELYEWALAVTFTPAERETFRAYFADARERNDASAAKLLRMAEKVLALDAAKLREIQPEFRDAFLADFNSAPDSATNRFLLGVYRRGRGDDAEAPSAAVERAAQSRDADANAGAEGERKSERESGGDEEFRPAEGAVRMSELVGVWEKAGVSSYGYRDTLTNDYRSGHGSAQMHEIRADGGFDYSNYATVSLYNCTTELFTSMKGRVTLSGARVTFKYVSGTVRGKDSCKATGFNKPAQISGRTYVLERAGDRVRLCEVGAEVPTCLSKTKR